MSVKTHDTACIKFRKWHSTTYDPTAAKAVSKYTHRILHFPSYSEALTYITNHRLGLLRDSTWEGWTPIELVRRVYTPGKGEVVYRQNLEDKDDTTNNHEEE